MADYEVLGRLHDTSEDGLRVRDLCATLGWEQSRLSHQLSRMQRRGLVRREECGTDRRGATFHLTPAGRTAIEQAAPGHVETVRTLVFDALSAEQVTRLTELTWHLLDHIEGSR